ncbi:4-hydroxy-tetrahydrodipicolinate synthase [Methylomarinovum caldicuralii]|uniref:4-hydroxy-tetrahydrodipicolinate synthase n=1 Tax=Methylomarinovum caldicuralii TaxID=438856 RepID=A0AAU9CA25_9GAMM|nr:4-hydroxy-tetrahydrodipicolinate synthase [Methylomarinovum caldicuralii]BCX81349.1 4-hydroxy-tetrahydrodipicolinate synthase [Methylomarinovum caldicuralii]
MIQGSIVALVTPMHPDGSLDEVSLRELVEWHVAEGTDAIVAVGTTGESATLDAAEHCRVIRWTVEQARGRIPVIAGTGSNCTREAIELTREAREAGADACLLVTPYYNKPTQEGLYRHYRAVAEAVAIPQILYNVPGRTACDLLPETVARLAEIDNIVGIKEASADTPTRAREIRALCPDFPIYSGDDATARQVCLEGGRGVISVTANVAPHKMHEMITAACAGDAATAERLDAPLAALHHSLFLESNPIPVKWALCEMEKIPAGIRLPLTWLSDRYHDEVRQALRQAGAL